MNDELFNALMDMFEPLHPALPLMLNGETMWVDVRTIATLEQLTGDRFMVHARKRNGQALVSRKPSIIFSGRGRSPYNGR